MTITSPTDSLTQHLRKCDKTSPLCKALTSFQAPCVVCTVAWAFQGGGVVLSWPQGVGAGAASCPWLVAGPVSVAPASPTSK